jgi:hypothetical protein
LSTEHHGKYRPLWQWLCAQPERQVRLSFVEIERILGFGRPASSRKHSPHRFSYGGSAVVRAIHDAGWKAENLDLNSQTVTLTKSR